MMMNVLQIDRPRFRPGSPQAFGVAIAIAAVAIVLRVMLTPWIMPLPLASVPFITLFPGVIIAACLCGSRAGFAAALLSIAGAWLFILAPVSYVGLYQTATFVVGTTVLIAIIGAMRAATENVRRLNETLRISEGKFRGLLESAPDAMIIVDEAQRIVLLNAATEKMFGYRRDEILGQPIELLVAEDRRAISRENLTSFIAGDALADEIDNPCARRANGNLFPVEVSLARLKTETGVLVSHAIRDITERRAIEASLAEASQAKSDFLARMSHELRTPLNAIIGFSEVIRDAVVGPVDVRYRGYGGDIAAAGRHLQNIINDILDISKIEGGRLELRDEVVAIDDLAESCRRIVAAMAEMADVALYVDIPSALPPVRSDALRLKQILLNLMSNAVKFTPAGGSVRVSAGVDANGATISVQDTGIGMKPDEIAIALQPFRQIDGASTHDFDGTGLGLPLAKALIELHDGRLEIESVPDNGTTVRIRLPQERIAAVAA
jgi:protein-histidine pros-kinase